MKNLIYLFTVLIILFNTFNIYNCYAQWQPDVRLTNDPAHKTTSYTNAWCVAASGELVHTVWTDKRNGNWEIYYKRSTNEGVTWEWNDIRLTNDAASSWYPSVSVSGLVVHVVWHDSRDGNGEIYYKRSTDGGSNWGTDTRLTNNTAYSGFPSLSVSNSAVYVVWWDYRDGNAEIYCKCSTDGGSNWGTDTRLTINTAESQFPSVSVAGATVHIAWHDTRDGNYEIYHKRSTDGGISWQSDTRLTNNSNISWYPSISVSNSSVYVVWLDNRDGNEEIYYIRSTDGGLSWGTDSRLTNNSASSELPSISVSGSSVHVVWTEKRDGNWEIYYKRSTDGGSIWTSDERLTNNSATSYYSSLSVFGSVVHVVWMDDRDGNFEIYYKRNPTGNLFGITNLKSLIPNSFFLYQNYPNPFNPTTKIRFDVPPSKGAKGSMVRLIIYDILGRDVTTLVNEQLKPGAYEVDWDGSNYTSGVYFYTIRTEGYTETKRMVLVK